MNNSWGNELYPTTMNMPMIQNMMQPPLMPPMCMMSELMAPMNSANAIRQPLIGPVQPDNLVMEDMNIVDEAEFDTPKVDQKDSKDNNKNDRASSKDSRGDRRDGRGDRSDRDRDRSRQSRSREQHDRSSDRNDWGDRNDRNRREKRTKWDNENKSSVPVQGIDGAMTNMIMQGGIMPFGNMNNLMGQHQMEMSNMSNMHGLHNMTHIPNMTNMPNMMPGMNMMPNMMGNMIDPMMMNQMMPMMGNQPIYFNNGVLLPPLPSTSMPSRRERPPGCRTIFIGGLPNGIKENVVHQIFQRFGDICNIKLHRHGVCHVRFEKQESVEQSFSLSGYRFKTQDQMENEATTLFIDYALNREDQNEYDKMKRNREPTPPAVEPFTATAMNAIAEKIKSDELFSEVAPYFTAWLERGECNKKNANMFYSSIQASNNQIRRLYNEKMALDDEYHNMKSSIKDKMANVIKQFEQVAKILTAAKHQRVSDHFTKQQRRNIEMWLKITEELENMKEEFNANFEDDDTEKPSKNMVPSEKYEELKAENESLVYELEGYKNEAHLAKNEAERKFEKFKAHFVAQQALQNNQQVYPPLPPPPTPNLHIQPPLPSNAPRPEPPPPLPNEVKPATSEQSVPHSEAKLISILTAFLMVHPLGASLDYLVSYVRSMVPNVTQTTVQQVLQKYTEVFCRKTTGIGASIEHRWTFVAYDIIKNEI